MNIIFVYVSIQIQIIFITCEMENKLIVAFKYFVNITLHRSCRTKNSFAKRDENGVCGGEIKYYGSKSV